MGTSPKPTFKDLKGHVANAIKESCYRTDARLYNIANQVHLIHTFSVEPGVELVEGLTKIIDKTIKESLALDCDLSVIVKGILLGAFRANPSIPQEAHKSIRLLVHEIIQPIFKYKGDIHQMIEGIWAAIIIIADEFKLNKIEALNIVREDILSSANALNSKFADDIKEALPNSDDPS